MYIHKKPIKAVKYTQKQRSRRNAFRQTTVATKLAAKIIGSSTFDVEFNPFDCMADYGLFQNLHKEVTACECQ